MSYIKRIVIDHATNRAYGPFEDETEAQEWVEDENIKNWDTIDLYSGDVSP